jgi:hypothetical protein
MENPIASGGTAIGLEELNSAVCVGTDDNRSQSLGQRFPSCFIELRWKCPGSIIVEISPLELVGCSACRPAAGERGRAELSQSGRARLVFCTPSRIEKRHWKGGS